MKFSLEVLCPGLRRISLVLLLILAADCSCSAVCEEPWPKPSAEFFHSNLVFSGKVLSERVVARKSAADGDDFEEIYYRISVRRLFRGQADHIILVYSSVDSAGIYLDKGGDYLLFAFKESGHKTLRISSCGNSGPLERAAGAIRQIEAIAHAGNYGEIEGEFKYYKLEDADPGLRIVVTGQERKYVAKVDNLGHFHLRVSPGRYSLRVHSEKFKAESFEFTFDDPENFYVYRGGSSQMALYLFPKKR